MKKYSKNIRKNNKSLELVEQTTDTNNYLLEDWARTGTTDNDGKINFF